MVKNQTGQFKAKYMCGSLGENALFRDTKQHALYHDTDSILKWFTLEEFNTFISTLRLSYTGLLSNTRTQLKKKSLKIGKHS